MVRKKIRRKPRRKGRQMVPRMNPFARTIFQELERARRPLTTRRIAKRSMITWPTAKRHLQEMQKEGLVIRTPAGNRVFWRKRKKT